VLYDILKAYKLEKLCKGDKSEGSEYWHNTKETAPAFRILQKEITVKPSFDVDKVNVLLQLKKVKKKYLPNPEPNWGPKARATGQ
jgi:hypothetical protein